MHACTYITCDTYVCTYGIVHKKLCEMFVNLHVHFVRELYCELFVSYIASCSLAILRVVR